MPLHLKDYVHSSIMIHFLRGSHDAKTKHCLRLSLETPLSLPALCCCVTMFNTSLFVILMPDARERSRGGGARDGARHHFLLFQLVFSLNIKQHFVDNYRSWLPSLHKTQFRAARSLQGIHAAVLFSVLLCAEIKVGGGFVIPLGKMAMNI